MVSFNLSIVCGVAALSMCMAELLERAEAMQSRILELEDAADDAKRERTVAAEVAAAVSAGVFKY